MADYLNNLSTYPVFRVQPDWENPIEGEFELNQKINSYAGTIDEVVTYSDERPFNTDLTFKLFDKAEEYEFIDFFVNRKGMWQRFWMPAPFNFFEVAEAVTTSDDFLVVKDRTFRDAHRGFERLFIELRNGDWLSFKISSVLPGPLGGQETLNLAAAFDRDIALTEIKKCSFIFLGRFDLDQITFDHYVDRASIVRQRFLELVEEYPA